VLGGRPWVGLFQTVGTRAGANILLSLTTAGSRRHRVLPTPTIICESIDPTQSCKWCYDCIKQAASLYSQHHRNRPPSPPSSYNSEATDTMLFIGSLAVRAGAHQAIRPSVPIVGALRSNRHFLNNTGRFSTSPTRSLIPHIKAFAISLKNLFAILGDKMLHDTGRGIDRHDQVRLSMKEPTVEEHRCLGH
jgi:hypothetical protein